MELKKIILSLMIILSFSFFGCTSKSGNEAIVDTEVVIEDQEKNHKKLLMW